MNKILNNKILRAIQRGLNEAFLNLNIDDIEDIEDDSTYILKKDINNKNENQYFINKLFLKYIDRKDRYTIEDLAYKGKKFMATDSNIHQLIQDVCNICINSGLKDLNWIDTSRVTDMSKLFYGIKFLYLQTIDISKWDVSNVTNMKLMFYDSTFNSDISSWDVSNVINMEGMFYESSFNLYIGKWNVSNVLNMSFMFLFDLSFSLDISNWNVSSVTNMKGMFCDALSFNCDISLWEVSSVENMNGMFYCASSFNLDISKWNVSSVTNMKDMFYNTRALSIIPTWYHK